LITTNVQNVPPSNELIGCKNWDYFPIIFPWYMSCQLFGNANHQDR